MPQLNSALSLLKHKQSMTKRHALFFKGITSPSLNTSIESQYLDNKEHFIYGCYPQQYKSSENALTLLEGIKIQSVLLGNTSLQNYQEYTQQNSYYQQPPSMYDRLEDIQAKDKLNRFYLKHFPTHPHIFKYSPNNLVYFADRHNHMQYFDEDLSIAYQVCGMPKVKMLFAKPDQMMHMEDLALTIPLSSLQDMFSQSLQHSSKQAKASPALFLLPNLILQNLRNSGQSLFSDILSQKTAVYQSSLLRASNESIGPTLLTTNNHLVNSIKDLIHLRTLPQIDNVYRSYLNIDQKNKIINNNKLTFVKPKNRIPLSNKKKIHPDFNFAEKDMQSFLDLPKQDPDEIIEKYVILNILIGNEFRIYLQHDHNPFNLTIYNEIIQNKYKSTQDICAKFEEIYDRYSQELHKLQNLQILELKERDSGSRNDYVKLPDQQKKIKEDYSYKFNIHQLNNMKQNVMTAARMRGLVDKYIEQEIQTNQMEMQDLEHIQSFRKGTLTVTNLKLMMNYFVRANDELGGLLTFPKVFKAALPQLSQYKTKQLVDFQQELEEKRIEIEERREQKIKFLQQNIGMKVEGKDINEIEMELENSGKKGEYLENIMQRREKKEEELRQKVYGVVQGGEGALELMQELQKMSLEDIESSDHLVASIDINRFADGSVRAQELDDEQGKQVDQLMKEMNQKEDNKLKAFLDNLTKKE